MSKTGPCADGSTRPCSIELGTYQGVVSCLSGSQSCDNHVWGKCAPDGTSTTYQVAAPPPRVSGVGTASIGGASTDCQDNPCDPFCKVFTDTPDAGITTTPTITTVGTTGGSLASSNVPPSFKTKGSLNAQCTTPCTTQSCLEACQFDQYCGTLSSGGAGCVAFDNQRSGACTGVDITAPTTCVPSAGFRDVTVCNRGTVAAPPGVQCFTFPGGSPQYPDAAPSLTHATLVMTTRTQIQPGACETQQIPEATFGSNGITSLMCNPPGSGAGAFVVETSAGTRFPTSNVDSGWTTPEQAYSADGVYATAALNQSSSGARYASVFSNDSGWTNPNFAFAADGAVATALPPITGTSSDRFPTTSSTTTWSNASYAYVAGEANSAQRYATVVPAMPPPGPSVTTPARFPTSNTGNACNHGNDCTWNNANNAYAQESPPAPFPSWVSAVLSESSSTADVASIYFGGFDFSTVPGNAVIQSLTITAHWKGSNKIASMSLGAYKAGGVTAVGTPLSFTTGGCNSSSAFDQTVSQTSTLSAGTLTYADITNAKFIKLTATHCQNSSNDAAYLDYVTVSVTYQGPGTPTTSNLTLGNFGISVPAGATITGLTTEAMWHVSAANANVTLGLQPYVQGGASAVGSELTTTATSALTSDTVADNVASSATVSALTATDLADGNFVVNVRAARQDNGTTNPDITVYLDYVKVTVSYLLGQNSSTVTLGNFGFSLPAGATVLGATTEVSWSADVSNPNVVIGAQPYSGTTPIGSELTVTSPPTATTTASITATSKSGGVALTPSDFADGTFNVQLRATRSAGGSNPDTTVRVDYVRVTVAYLLTATDRVLYQGFGFSVPPARDLMSLKAEVKWRISASNPNVVLGFQAYKDNGVTPVGTEITTTLGSSPPTVDTVVTSSLDIASLTATDLDDPGFGVVVRATRGAGMSPNGDVTAYVDYVKLTATYATPTGGNLPECNPYNNWSATKSVPSPDACQTQQIVAYPPFTETRVFQANCPYGTGPRWGYFAYDSRTPSDSNIAFRLRTFAPTGSPPTCVALAAATSDPPTPVVVAHSTPTDTQSCPVNGSVSGCPVDLHYSLGPNNTACLQMDAQGTPSSDGTAAPTLNDWTVFYDCIDNQ